MRRKEGKFLVLKKEQGFSLIEVASVDQFSTLSEMALIIKKAKNSMKVDLDFTIKGKTLSGKEKKELQRHLI